MLIPNTAQIADYVFNLLDLQLESSKRISIDSRSEFLKQNELFKEKCSLITTALSEGNNDLWLYMGHTMGVFQDVMKEFNTYLAPLAMEPSSERKNRIAFISYFFIPFIITSINKLDNRVDSTSVLHTLKEWLIEILCSSKDTKIAIKSNSIDVEAFIRRKLSHVIPRGTCGDIKNNLASNKGWKSFSYNDDINKKIINDIKIDFLALGEEQLMPKVITIIKAGGILRNALKKYSFKDLIIPNYEEVIFLMDSFLISPNQVEENIDSFKETDSSKEFINVFKMIDIKLIKENNPEVLRRIRNLNMAIKQFPHIASNNDINSSLLYLHNCIGEFEQFDLNLLNTTMERANKTCDKKVLNRIISNAHEQIRQEFISYIEELEKIGASSDQIMQLSCIILAISSVTLETVQHNKMTKLLAIIRRNLSSFGDFCDMPFFTTCFNRGSSTPIDYQRFNEDNQILAYAIRVYNQLIIKNVPISSLEDNVIMPLMHIDIELEELIDSYHNGKFNKNKVKELTSSKRFWRLDQSSAYEVLRDIDFYIKVFGVHLDEKNVIIPVGLNRYIELSDKIKKQILKVLDPIQYEKDEATEKRATKAKESGASSYIGSDGLPVFIIKPKQVY